MPDRIKIEELGTKRVTCITKSKIKFLTNIVIVNRKGDPQYNEDVFCICSMYFYSNLPLSPSVWFRHSQHFHLGKALYLLNKLQASISLVHNNSHEPFGCDHPVRSILNIGMVSSQTESLLTNAFILMLWLWLDYSIFGSTAQSVTPASESTLDEANLKHPNVSRYHWQYDDDD